MYDYHSYCESCFPINVSLSTNFIVFTNRLRLRIQINFNLFERLSRRTMKVELKIRCEVRIRFEMKQKGLFWSLLCVFCTIPKFNMFFFLTFPCFIDTRIYLWYQIVKFNANITLNYKKNQYRDYFIFHATS